uniref:serine protease HTRA3-like isoform X1 n=1 Tax=Myxine glutinosa TaxID=7769 RepID=UPI00358FBC14
MHSGAALLLLLLPLPLLGAPSPPSACSGSCERDRCPPLPSSGCPVGVHLDACRCCEVCTPGEGEPCAPPGSQKACGIGLTCRDTEGKRKAKGVCSCKRVGPVCGVDGNTYTSACKLHVAGVKALHAGTCRSDVNLSMVHTALQDQATGAHLDELPSAIAEEHNGSLRYKFNFIADVVERIVPAVVHIELYTRHPFFNRNISVASGSGFIVSDDGTVVTNAHVVLNKRFIKVQLHDGKSYEATVVDANEKVDVATIRIKTKDKLSVLPLGRSAELRPGEFVVAIGSPFKLQNTVTTGIVSTAQRGGKELGLEGSDIDYIQTDAIINYGNSGGPLVNLDGEVIGINTLKVTAGISFAIPSDRIRDFLQKSNSRKIRGEEKPTKKFIGIRMSTLNPRLLKELRRYGEGVTPTSGIYIHEVITDSPAAKAGLREGDVIVRINGKATEETSVIQQAVRNESVLSVVVRRGNKDLKFTIVPATVDVFN